ncbi:hypothetical protein WN55_03775 [Dufourea novaeangliae]|uniref:Uncharacterized protein n=1 Tax=Dufourea novaeangliae TaxID=178035 RepID=A0A154PK54_DUFNO|nr:hypothetical protein WN55_03775 [Dufourea novaeangliae]
MGSVPIFTPFTISLCTQPPTLCRYTSNTVNTPTFCSRPRLCDCCDRSREPETRARTCVYLYAV